MALHSIISLAWLLCIYNWIAGHIPRCLGMQNPAWSLRNLKNCNTTHHAFFQPSVEKAISLTCYGWYLLAIVIVSSCLWFSRYTTSAVVCFIRGVQECLVGHCSEEGFLGWAMDAGDSKEDKCSRNEGFPRWSRQFSFGVPPQEALFASLWVCSL